MIKVLFICHGNICRSPMGEFILKDMTQKRGIAHKFYIESAATSTEEIGNPVYPPARNKLRTNGIDCTGKTARQITKADYKKFDYIFCADSYNVKNAMRIFGSDPENKVCRLLDLTDRPRDIADPWYTGNFDITWDDIVEGCEAFLDKI